MRNIDIFKKHLREQRAVKIIAGINNFNVENVKSVCIAAQSGMASAVDVACSKEIIEVAKANTKLTVFASGTNARDLANAIKWGADAVEVGNFEAMYKMGQTITAEDVYRITEETKTLVPEGTFISVTIPGNIEMREQIELAKRLEVLGIDLIQTEGTPKSHFTAFELAQTTIANTLELSRQVSVPVMSASGLTPETVPLAFASGARAVGVGSCVNKLDTQIAMIATVRNIVGAVAYNKNYTFELAKETMSVM